MDERSAWDDEQRRGSFEQRVQTEICQRPRGGTHSASVLKAVIDRPEVTWKQSFAVRFAVVWALVLGIAVGVSGWISYRDASQQLLAGLNETVEQDARVVELRLQTWLETLANDTRSVSQSPMVKEFLRTRGTVAEDRWRAMVEEGFRAVFTSKPTYIQMRLLEVGGSREGREIIRMNREGGNLLVTPRDQLQEKGGRDYFKEALSLPAGEIYLSEINLNRDFGEITLPRLPTIRAAIRTGNESGREVMLIINADLGLLFEDLRNLASDEAEIYLGDEKGDYLMHENFEVVFASDLGHPVRFDPEIGEGGVASAREITVGQPLERTLFLRVLLRDESWRPVLAQSLSRGIWTTVFAALGGAVLALVIAWFFARRLATLTRALRRFDGKEGGEIEGVADSRHDEIGAAIARFEEMAQKVREHVDDLHRAREEAEKAEEAKENFLAIMSHEIRTPMNAVVGLVTALEANAPTPRQKPILASLRSSTNNLMTLLNTALDYTRLQAGEMRYEKGTINVSELAREVVGELKPIAMTKNLTLELSASDRLLVVGDRVRLRQVLNNLLNNALKFTVEGFVKLRIWYEHESLVGEVSDSGPGIPAEDRARIFAPFYSRAEGGQENGAGAGLGLSVSHDMIEQQGGTLTLDCPPEGGTVFRFTLPFPECGEDHEESLPSAGQVHLPDNGARILYVEDTPSNQEVMALSLADSGLELTCVGTGAEALALVARQGFDLVMVDLQLPDGSGVKLAAKIKNVRPCVPVILVTAQASAKNERFEDGGVIAEVILKPYTREAILSAIAMHLGSDFGRSLSSIHPDDPVKAVRLARTMAAEFEKAALEVESASSEAFRDVVKRVQHRLTTALALFPLEKVEKCLDQVMAAEGYCPGRIAELVRALQEAGAALGGES